MKEKVMLILVATMILLLTFAPFAKAFPNLAIFGYPDRSQYRAGDSGSLTFWIVNLAADPATLKNITIEYPWFIDNTRLGGNYTIIISDTVTLNLNQNYTYTHQFTVPNDGRAQGGSVYIRAYFEYYDTSTPPQKHSAYASGYISLNVATSSFLMSLTDLGMLQNLLIFNMVITLIAAFIIAAAVFMSKRGPPTA